MNIAAALSLPALEEEMSRIDAALAAAVRLDDPYLSEVAGHLISAGGKRLRPMLSVLSAMAGGADVSDDVIAGGVAVELVQVGSLYHDDVIDGAETRRGSISVNARWGNIVAILAGDFLLAKASEIAASLGTEVAGLLATTIGRLCSGQITELQTLFQASRTEEAYLASIREKTASLIGASTRIGAITAGLSRPEIDALTAFGEAFGMVFQIRDDILDITATDEELGKPAGNDLVEGVYTLPVIRALAMPEVGAELAALLGSPLDTPERDKARDIVRASGAVDQAVALGREWAQRAQDALSPMTQQPVAASLSTLGHRLIEDL